MLLRLGCPPARADPHRRAHPGEFAGATCSGAFNIPLDLIRRALLDTRAVADRGDVLMVCASGARSENACANGIRTATLSGGTVAWAADGHDLHQPAVPHEPSGDGAASPAERRAFVLLGLLLGLVLHSAFQLLSAGIAAVMVFSALTNTCGVAAMLARHPHNRSRVGDLDQTLAVLRER